MEGDIYFVCDDSQPENNMDVDAEITKFIERERPDLRLPLGKQARGKKERNKKEKERRRKPIYKKREQRMVAI